MTEILKSIQIEEINLDLEKGLPENKQFTCGICYCDYDENQENLKMLETCKHKFCGECFKGYYTSLIM